VFGFAQWDSLPSLVLEALLSIAIVVALLFVVRRVNANAAAERERYLKSTADRRPNATGDLPSEDDALRPHTTDATSDHGRLEDNS